MIEVTNHPNHVSVTTTKKSPVVNVDATNPSATKQETDIDVYRQETVPVVSEHGIGEQGPQGPPGTPGAPGETGVVAGIDPIVYIPETRTVSLDDEWLDPPDAILLFENAIL